MYGDELSRSLILYVSRTTMRAAACGCKRTMSSSTGGLQRRAGARCASRR